MEKTTATTGTVRRFTMTQADVSDLRQRIKGYLLCMVTPGESASVGEMSTRLGVDPTTLGTHCRALYALGEINAVGNARGRRYMAIIS